MTQKKIAELANVSLSTVSKALSGSKEVSEELSCKIKKIAMETGYFKEKSKRKLEYEKEKSAVIAVICPEIISISYLNLINSIKTEVEALGGQLAIYVYDFDSSKLNQIVQMLVVKSAADGIILISSTMLDIKPTLPVVYFGKPKTGCEYDTITNDLSKLMNDAVSYLKNMGHTDIGYVGETLTLSKCAAFKEAMKNSALPIQNKFIHTINKRFEEIGYLAAQNMIKEKRFPTAIITAYDEIALAMIHEFQNNNIKIPEDISIMGINDIPAAAYAQIPLTTVKIFENEKCHLAVNILFDKIFNENKAIKHIYVDHELIIRKSVDKPRKNAAL